MLGPEGPVLRAARQLVMADELLVETTAIVDVRVDAAPGVRLGLMGQTLNEGAGQGSTSLNLSPTAPLQAEQVFDTAGRHQDRPIQQ